MADLAELSTMTGAALVAPEVPDGAEQAVRAQTANIQKTLWKLRVQLFTGCPCLIQHVYFINPANCGQIVFARPAT